MCDVCHCIKCIWYASFSKVFCRHWKNEYNIHQDTTFFCILRVHGVSSVSELGKLSLRHSIEKATKHTSNTDAVMSYCGHQGHQVRDVPQIDVYLKTHPISISTRFEEYGVIILQTTTGRNSIQYIPRNMHTVFALLCFVVVIHWLIVPYPSGLLHWHCGNLTIAPVPAKQPWWIWINTSCEFIMNDCISTTKQSTTKPCAYFLGYTVYTG